MPANVETMFYFREKPWHGLGTEVQEAPTSADALIYAGLDWEVIQKDVYTENGSLIPGYKVNLRDTDSAPLGIVSDRYKVVQNEDAFQFTDDLLGAGVTYETAGALQGGRKVWMLARMPHRYIIAGDEIAPYLVVMNSHDGSSGIKVAMTPIQRTERDLPRTEAYLPKGVEFISKKEAIDTSTPTGKFMLTIFGAVAELEREYILQRQREGIAIAKEQGKYTGRKVKQSPDFERVVAQWRSGEITAVEAMRTLKMSKTTFYRKVKVL